MFPLWSRGLLQRTMPSKMVRPKECIWQLVEQLTILVRQRKRQGQRERRVERKWHQRPRQRQKQRPRFGAVRSAACKRVGRMQHRRRSRVAGHLGLSRERVATLWHVVRGLEGQWPEVQLHALSSDDEEPQKQVDPCCSKDHPIACEDRRVTVDT